MRRAVPLMPTMVPMAERFFERERNRVEHEYFEGLRAARGLKPSMKLKDSYEQRLREKLIAKGRRV